MPQLCHARVVDGRGQWGEFKRVEQLLAVAEQVADVGLEQRRGVRVGLLCVDQVPALVGDRVGVRARVVDRGEGQVGRGRDVVRGGGGTRGGGRDVAAGRVLDRRRAQPRGG